MKIRIKPPRPPQRLQDQPPFNPSTSIPDPTTTIPTTIDDSLENLKQTRIMEKFRNAVFKLAASDPTLPLTPDRNALIESHLLSLCPIAATAPSHLTYAAMIHRAIEELNEDGGSNEITISEFIRFKYDDLPWAHSRLLRLHLEKLCERGEIAVTASGCHFISNLELAPACQLKPKWRGRRRRRQQWEMWSPWKGRKRQRMVGEEKQDKGQIEEVVEENLEHGKEEEEKDNVVNEGNLEVEKVQVVEEEDQWCEKGRWHEEAVVMEQNRGTEERFDRENRKLRWASWRQCRDNAVEKEKQEDEMEKCLLDDENQKHGQGRKRRHRKSVVVEDEEDEENSFEMVKKRKRKWQLGRVKQCKKDVVVEESQELQIEVFEEQNQPIERNVVVKEEFREEKNVATEEQIQEERQIVVLGGQIVVLGEQIEEEKEDGVIERQGQEPAGPIHLGEAGSYEDVSSGDVFFDCRDESFMVVMEGEENEDLEEQQPGSIFGEMEHQTKEGNDVFDKQNQAEPDDVTMRVEKYLELGQQQKTHSPCREEEFAVTEVVELLPLEPVQQQVGVSMPTSVDKPDSLKQAEREQSEVLISENYSQLKHPIGEESMMTKSELLPSDCQVLVDMQKQQQPLKSRRGRPPKPKPEAEKTDQKLLPSDHLSDKQLQPHRGRGRPPKQNLATTTGESLLSSQEKKQVKRRGRGRPPKPKPVAIVAMEDSVPS